jgi:hypothetical protein
MEPQRTVSDSQPADATRAAQVVPSAAPSPPRVKRPWILLRSAIGGLPEAEQFETPEQLDQAVHEISRSGGTPRSIDWWIGLVCLLIAVLISRWIAKSLLYQVNWHPALEEALLFAAIFATAGVTIWLLHRWGSRDALREKLIARGIPVCRGCGYSLRGQTPASKACPECGRPIDGDVSRMLIATRPTRPHH